MWCSVNIQYALLASLTNMEHKSQVNKFAQGMYIAKGYRWIIQIGGWVCCSCTAYLYDYLVFDLGLGGLLAAVCRMCGSAIVAIAMTVALMHTPLLAHGPGA